MPTATLFPYRTINDLSDGGIDFVLESYEGPIEVDDLNRRLVLTMQPTDTVNLVFRIQLPVSAAEQCLPLGSKPETSIQLGARLVSPQSRFRRFVRTPNSAFTRTGIGADSQLNCEVSIALEPSECRGKVAIEPLALLDRALPQSERSTDRAFARGSILGWADSWEVIFDLESPPSGQGIQIRWISFVDQFPRNPERHADLFAIEDGPSIVLNSAVAGLHETLHSRARTGAIARVRDMVNHQIVLQAWTSMIGASLLEFQRKTAEHSDLSARDIVEEMSDWKKRVIRDWVRYLIPGFPDIEDAVEALQLSLAGGHDLMTLVVPNAIQSRFKTSKSFDSMMVEFGDRLQGSSNV